MSKFTIPCVEEKCLKYPICKNKSSIKCSLLKRFFLELMEEYRCDALRDSKVWERVWEFLPKIIIIENVQIPPKSKDIYYSLDRRFYKGKIDVNFSYSRD